MSLLSCTLSLLRFTRFDPGPQAIYPAVRDSKAAIRWLRGVSEAGGALLQGSVLATDYVGAGGWSAGACTTAFLASQQEGDFTDEMNAVSALISHPLPKSKQPKKENPKGKKKRRWKHSLSRRSSSELEALVRKAPFIWRSYC